VCGACQLVAVTVVEHVWSDCQLVAVTVVEHGGVPISLWL
jgi:hypothetical protein